MKTIKLITILFFIAISNKVIAQSTVAIGSPSTNIAKSTTTVSFIITYTGATSVTLVAANVTITHAGLAVGGDINIIGSGTASRTVEINNVTGDGSYTISIAAGTSTDGTTPDEGTGPSSSVTVDNTSPADPAVTAISNDTGTNTADGITSDQTLTISGTAENNASVEVFLDAASIGSTTANGSGAWSYTYGTSIAAGNYSISAKATDAAGNISGTSLSYDINIDISAALPVVTAISDDTGTNTTDGITNDQTLTISGTAENNSSVEVFLDAASIGTIAANGSGAWSYTYGTSIAAGIHSITAKATDVAGNVSGTSLDYDINIDISAPAAPAVTAITNDTGTNTTDGITSDQTLTISGTAENSSSVEVFLDAASIGTTTANGSGAWSYTYGTSIAAGSHSITAKATDAAGNLSGTSAGYAINIDISAPAAPVISGISAGTFNTDQTFTVSGEAGATIEYSTDNESSWTAYTGAVILSAEDTYNVLAHQTDQAGNGPISSAVITLTIDKTGPNAPLVTGTASTNDQTPTWSWSAGGGGNGTFRYKLDDSNLTSGATTTASLSYTPGTNLSEESHTLYVQERDAAGTWSVSGSFTITIDITTQPPTLTLPSTPSYDNKDLDIDFYLPEAAYSGSVKMTFTGDLVDPTLHVLTFKSAFESSGQHTTVLNGQLLTSNANVLSISGNAWLEDGAKYTVKIEYKDLLGNLVASDENSDFSYDNTNPTATIVAISPDPINTPVGLVTINFSSFVWWANVNRSDFILTKDGSEVPLGGLPAVTYTLEAPYVNSARKYYIDLSSKTTQDGLYVLTLDASISGITDWYSNSLITDASVTWTMDATPPTLSDVHIQSNNANTAYAKVGDEVTVSFTSSETIQTPTATINGHPATINFVSGNSWTAKYIMVNGDTEGDVTFSIVFKDIAGNNGTSVSSVTDISSVYFAKTAPTLSTTTIKSNNANIALAKSGDIITLDFTSPKALANVVVTIAGHTVTATGSGSDKIWTASYTMIGTDAEGTIPFTINFTDKPGNAGVQVSSASTSVLFDRTLPALSSVSISSNYVNTNKVGIGGIVTLTITGSENLVINTGDIKFEGNNATITGSNNSWSATYTMQASNTAGIVPFTIDFKDLAGNIGTQVIASTNGSSVTFDQTSPVLSSVSILSNNTVNTQAKVGDLISISFTASEPIEGVVIKLNGKNVTATNPSGNNWTASYTMLTGDAEGSLYITIDCKDFSGNTAQITNTSITFDKSAPILTEVKISSNNVTPTYAKTGDIVTLTFKTNEDIKTPVVGTNLGNASVSGGPRDWIATRTIAALDAQGLITFSIPTIDLSDNSGTTGTSTTNGSSVTVDCSLPTISATVPFGVYKVGSTIPVTITSDDKIYTGQTISVNSEVQTLINNNNNTYTINYQVQEGDNQHSSVASLPVNLILQDYAGNTNAPLASATVVGGTLTLNSTTPQISFVSSDAAGAGILKIDDQIVFTITTVVAEVGLNITPTTYNSKPLVWATTNGGATYTATYTVQEGDADQVVPLQLASVTIADGAGNTSAPFSYTGIGKSIYGAKPTYTITGSASRCFGSTPATLPVTITFTGKPPFTFIHNNGTGNQPEVTQASNTFIVNISYGMVTLFSLSDGSTNSATINAATNATITENSLPTITFINSLNPGLTINKLADAYKLMDFVTSPTGGTFTGDCVGTSGAFAYFYPSLAGVTTTPVVKTITYSYTNSGTGCTGTSTFNIQVTGTKAFLTGLSSNKSYCITAAEPTHIITATGMGATITDVGTFSGKTLGFSITDATQGVEWDNNTTPLHSITIDPKLFSTGTHDITYTYVEDGTLITTTETITIVRVSTTIDFGPLSDKYCSNSEPVTLVGDLPVGTGHFTCSSIGFSTVANSNSATFTPSAAPVSVPITISYYYETPEGCQSVPKEHATIVNPIPTPDFTIKDNYNFDETPIFLNPPANGSYSGEIISSNTIFPLYASKIGFDIPITYTLIENGCSGSITHNTKVYRANAVIKVGSANMADSYCYREDAEDFDISCDPAITGSYDFTFTSTKNALIQTSDHIASYSITKALAGTDIIKFKYYIGTGINKTPYEIVKNVFIDSIGVVSFDLESNYCKNNVPVQVLGTHRVMNGENSYSITRDRVNIVKPNAFIFNSLYATFTPSIADTGSFKITYTFTSDKGCTQTITKQTLVSPVPEAKFSLAASCPGINKDIAFTNQTEDILGSEITWNWTFEPNKESTLKNPTFSYTFAGLKPVKLVATIQVSPTKGCSSEITNYYNVGVSAKADFSWTNDCLNGDSVKFKDESSGGTVTSYSWKYNNAQISDKKNMNYLFPNLGSYNLSLAIKTQDGCDDEITKPVVIQPYIKFLDLPQHIYTNNFESGIQDWNAKSILDGGNSSWKFGIPNGDVFNEEASSNAWYTNIGLSTQKVENSQVISPCYDLRGLTKPMIKMNIWSAPEAGRDGAVLQFSTDGGTTWKTNSKDNNLGSANQGINWFDPGNISSKPAGQSAGWSSTDAQTGWKIARHNLDTLKGLSNVRFRIVYANEANNIKPFNGFAFDDVWIGDRQQMILSEYFTNSAIAASVASDDYINRFEKSKKEDIIPVHYHTGSPIGDVLFNDYTAGPSSRLFYYGASQVPYVYVNGLTSSELIDASSKSKYEKSTDIETLKDPMISIGLNVTSTNVSLELKALKDLSGDNLVLYCAVVKDSILVGNVYHYNVLRKFIPNPGGILLPTSGWLSGQTINQSIPVNIDKSSSEFINARVVVFVQNNSTNQVYQAASFKLSEITGVHPIDISNLVDVYPNPARDYLIIECESSIDKLTVYDLTGRIVGHYIPSQSKYSLPIQNMESGLYILKGSTKKGEFIRKFIKQ